MRLRVQWGPWPWWIKRKSDLSQIFWREISMYLDTAGKRALRMVRERTPGEGRLRSSWQLFRDGPTRAAVRSTADQEGQKILWFLEFGTRGGYDIPKGGPKLGVILSWIDEDTGERVFTRYVPSHPGIKAYRMIYDTQLKLQQDPVVQDAISQMTVNLIRALERANGER